MSNNIKYGYLGKSSRVFHIGDKDFEQYFKKLSSDEFEKNFLKDNTTN